MISVHRSDFIDLQELSQQVANYAISFDLLAYNKSKLAKPGKQVIEVTKDHEDKVCMNVISQNNVSRINPFFQTITFEDHECEAMSYFLQNWDYAVCHLYTQNNTTIIEVHYQPRSN